MSAMAVLALLALACQLVQLIAVQHSSGPASFSQGGTGVGTGAGNDAAAGKVASEVSDSGADGSTTRSKLRVLRALHFMAWDRSAMNCMKHPTLCDAPFNCRSNPPTLQEQQTWRTVRVATPDGHSNIRSWCTATAYEDGIAKLCLKNQDLKGNAQVTYELQVGRGIGELDGSYCFLEGHCADTRVTYGTTVEKAEALCDAKYGHENWTSASLNALPEVPDKSAGFSTRDQTRPFGMLACAMGNYHCDVVYCRDTYCKNPHYVERYGHYLKEYGWV